MSVDTDYSTEALHDVRREFGNPVRQCAAVGVAQHEYVGSGVLRGFKRAQSEVLIGRVAIEKVFGVIDDLAAVLFQVTDSARDYVEVFFFADVETIFRVKVPALAEDGDYGCSGANEFLHI